MLFLLLGLTGCSINEKAKVGNSTDVDIPTKAGIEESKTDNEISIVLNKITYDLNSILHFQDIINLDKDELGLLRNSFYAKHGYIFKNKTYSEYFSKMKWYSQKFDDVSKLLSNDDIKNIDLILKVEKNFQGLSNQLTNEEKRLIGFWNLGAGLGAGYSYTYRFYEDRTFKYAISTMVLDERKIDEAGRWFILNDKLYLQVEQEGMLVGGELIDTMNPGSASDKEIVGAKYEIKKLNPPELKILDIGFNSDKINIDYPYDGVLVGEQDFYRHSNNPDINAGVSGWDNSK